MPGNSICSFLISTWCKSGKRFKLPDKVSLVIVPGFQADLRERAVLLMQ